MAEKDCTEVGLAEKSEPTAGEKIENEKLEGVKVQEAIIKLKLLGQMPDAVKDDPTVETKNRTADFINRLLTVWESSVRATHLFLSDSEIKKIKEIYYGGNTDEILGQRQKTG